MKYLPQVLSVILIVLLFSVQSCRKEPVPVTTTTYDTAHPRPYFPAYPGSYWNYLVNGDTVTAMAAGYEKAYEHFSPDNYYVRVGVRVSSPVLGGMFLGYKRHIKVSGGQASQYCDLELPFFSETLGEGFHMNESGSASGCENGCHRLGEVVQFYPQYTVNQQTFDSVYVIESKSSAGCGAAWWPHHSREYYAKNIGLVYSMKVDTALQDTVRYELLNWHINH